MLQDKKQAKKFGTDKNKVLILLNIKFSLNQQAFANPLCPTINTTIRKNVSVIHSAVVLTTVAIVKATMCHVCSGFT